jgi:hypothetical protein
MSATGPRGGRPSGPAAAGDVAAVEETRAHGSMRPIGDSADASAPAGFAADAVPLRPAADRPDQAEGDELALLIADRRRRRRGGNRRRRLVVGGALIIAVLSLAVAIAMARRGGPAPTRAPSDTASSNSPATAPQVGSPAQPKSGAEHHRAASREPGRRTQHPRRRRRRQAPRPARNEPRSTAPSTGTEPSEESIPEAPAPEAAPASESTSEPRSAPETEAPPPPPAPATSAGTEKASEAAELENQFGFER